MSTKQNPLTWSVPIVDSRSGRPTPEFMRKWQLQTQINETILDLSTAQAVSNVIDKLGAVQGDILYRASASWTVLAPATAGWILKTGGAGANPSWASISSVLDSIGSTQGDILYRDAVAWAVLAPGASGNFLQTQGAGANPQWAAGGLPSLTSGDIWVGNGSNVATAVAPSGDVTMTNAGAFTIKSSVALAGNPTTTTQTGSDNSTKIATTAMVQAAISAGAVAKAAAFHPGFQSGRWYSLPQGGGSYVSQSTVANTLYTMPFYVPVATTFTQIGIRVTSSVAASHIELGVYANSNGYPGALILDAGEIDSSTGGLKSITGLSLTLAPGWYFLACWTSAAIGVRGVGQADAQSEWLLGSADLWNAGVGIYTTTLAFVTGALPNPFTAGASTNNGNSPMVALSL